MQQSESHVRRVLFQIIAEELFNPVKRDFFHVVVEVGVAGARHNQQLLVVALQFLEGILAEVAGVGLFAVYNQDGAAYFAGIRQDGHVDERERRGDVPAQAGVDGAGVVAALRLVVVVIVLHELRRVGGRFRVHHGALAGAVPVVLGALRVELLAHGVAGVGVVVGVKVSVGGVAADVVHCGGHGGLDACVHGGRIEGKAAEAADAQDADACRVDIVAGGQVVYGGAEVLGVDVRRGHAAGLSAALAGKRRVEGEGQEAALGQCLRIQARGLLLDGAERSADGNGREWARGPFGLVEVGGQRDAVAVAEGHLAVAYLVALRESLVPFRGECQFFHKAVVCVVLCRTFRQSQQAEESQGEKFFLFHGDDGFCGKIRRFIRSRRYP